MFNTTFPVCAPISDDVNSGESTWAVIILILLISTQCFYGLALVVDEYFCPSLQVLCEEFNISNDISGATFLAIGSSAGDLAISVISLFVYDSTLGLGTIIGSELFNHLVISACCALSSAKPLQLDYRKFTRDCIAYAVTLLCLMYSLREGSFNHSEFKECLPVHWYNGGFLMCVYLIYVLVAINFSKFCDWMDGKGWVTTGKVRLAGTDGLNSDSDGEGIDMEDISTQLSSSDDDDNDVEKDVGKPLQPKIGPVVVAKKVIAEVALKSFRERLSSSSSIESYGSNDDKDADAIIEEEETAPLMRVIPLSEKCLNAVKRATHYVFLPLSLLLSYTMPDPSVTRNRKYYPLTSILSICYIGILAEGLLFSISSLADLLGISPTLMGLTLSSIGASLPTLFASLNVTRQGQGDMAISNAMGANVFSVLIGLGLPWMIYPIHKKHIYFIEDDGIIPLLIVMILSVGGYWCVIWWDGFVLERRRGVIFLAVYIAILVLCIFVFY